MNGCPSAPAPPQHTKWPGTCKGPRGRFSLEVPDEAYVDEIIDTDVQGQMFTVDRGGYL